MVDISYQGDWLGDYELILKEPMHCEGLLRVPMILRGMGKHAGKAAHDPASTLDLGETLRGDADAPPLVPQNGASLRPMIDKTGQRE